MFERRHTLWHGPGTGLARPWHGQNLDKQGLGTVSRPFTPPTRKNELAAPHRGRQRQIGPVVP